MRLDNLLYECKCSCPIKGNNKTIGMIGPHYSKVVGFFCAFNNVSLFVKNLDTFVALIAEPINT
jgi:hypothetical protein